jgi:hypothetical protein
MRRGKGGARVATAGPEAEGPSDVPPMASRGRPVGGGDPTCSLYQVVDARRSSSFRCCQPTHANDKSSERCGRIDQRERRKRLRVGSLLQTCQKSSPGRVTGAGVEELRISPEPQKEAWPYHRPS